VKKVESQEFCDAMVKPNPKSESNPQVDSREFCDAMENVFANADRAAALAMVAEFDVTGDGKKLNELGVR